MSAGLQDWYGRIAEFENANYWPGPRPLKSNDPDEQLVGRDREIREVTRLLMDNQLLVLNGATGDGKSSLLDKGVQPTLVGLGSVVLLCNRWSGSGADAQDSDGFLRAKLEPQLPSGIAPGVGYLQRLDEVYGERAVIVLDQFEELIRHHPVLFGRVCRWIERVVDETNVRIIVSLREEYLPRLRALRVGPYSRRDFRVEPLRDPETIRKIVESGWRKNGGDTITGDAVDDLVQLWVDARGAARDTAIGVLHLQALLYVLWRDRPEDGVIGKPLVGATVSALIGDDPEDDPAVAAFQGALPRVVALRLRSCGDVYEDLGGEPALATGASMIIRRIASYLSSGGYKVDQDRWHLAELVLADELSTLDFRTKEDLRIAEALFTNVARIVDRHHEWMTNRPEPTDPAFAAYPAAPLDYLDATRAELRNDEDQRDSLVAFLRGGGRDLAPTGERDPWDTDPDSLTGGMMMGATLWETLLEVFRQYFFALDWLEASVLVRQAKRQVTRTVQERAKDETTISLIHDGFGRGLVSWSLQDTRKPEEHFRLLIAAVGETIRWDVEVDGRVDPAFRYAVNLRWKSCLVREAKFRHVTFVNCDFRNSTFVDCEFEAVRFINCLLDGVSLDGTTFTGAVERLAPLTDAEKDALKASNFDVRSFRLPLDADDHGILRSLDRYRESPVPADFGKDAGLYSLTSGVPATPLRGLPEQESGDLVDDVAGGFVMNGGRISSLVFANCRFVDHGGIALRDLAGTSLEFAEQDGGSIEIRNVALRGLTVSAPLPDEHGIRPRMKPVTIYAYNSTLQNVWFSDGLPGKAEFDDCGVYQVARHNPEFVIDDTKAGSWGRLELNDGEPEFDERKLKELDDIALKVDYRSTPAKREIEARRSKKG